MRTVTSSIVLSVLAFGLAGEARADALSDIVGKLPMPSFSLNCLEPADKDAPSGAGSPVQRDRRETAPTAGQGEIDADRPRSDDPAMPATSADAGSDKGARGRSPKWKALLPGALK